MQRNPLSLKLVLVVGLAAGLLSSGPAAAQQYGTLDTGALGAGIDALAVLIWAPPLVLMLVCGVALAVLLRQAPPAAAIAVIAQPAAIVDETAVIEALRGLEPVAPPRKRRLARQPQRRSGAQERALSAPASAL